MGKEHQPTPKHEVQPLVLGDPKVDVLPAKAKEKDDLGAPAKKFSPFVRQVRAAIVVVSKQAHKHRPTQPPARALKAHVLEQRKRKTQAR